MSFPKYPKYQEVGAGSLGEVPAHWTVTQLKRVVDANRQITYGIVQAGPHVSDGVPYIRPADMTDEQGLQSFDDVLRTSPEIACAYSRSKIFEGDLVCSIGPSFGKVMITPKSLNGANLTQGTARVAIAEPNVARYFFWVLRSSQSLSQWESSVGGATFRALNLGPLAETAVAVPPPSEQAQIAIFLDIETEKIDALVAEQRRLIELLKEKRQAVISHAVTKGLNPHAPMKDSGIEWLGEVPAHWEVKSMRLIANVVRGASPRPAGDPRYFDGDSVPWVTVAEITKDNGMHLLETETSLTAEGAKHSNLFRKGTLVYSNSGATLGVPKILAVDACANDGVVAFLDLTPSVLPEFLYHCLASITDNIRDKIRQGSGQPNLNTDIVKTLQFAFPSLSEQQHIVEYLHAKQAEFRSLSVEAQRAVDLLLERRTALTSSAVTGQIDVRNIKERRSAA